MKIRDTVILLMIFVAVTACSPISTTLNPTSPLSPTDTQIPTDTIEPATLAPTNTPMPLTPT
ncbi:MAG: hypothetical protein P8046_15805, partial [Anaerolineales bacterium]